MKHIYILILFYTINSYSFILFESKNTEKAIILNRTSHSVFSNNPVYDASLPEFFNTINDHVTLERNRTYLDSLNNTAITIDTLAKNPFLFLDECHEQFCILNSQSWMRGKFLEMLKTTLSVLDNDPLVVVDYGSGALRFLLRSIKQIKEQNILLEKIIVIDPEFSGFIYEIKNRDTDCSLVNNIVSSNQLSPTYQKLAFRFFQFLEAVQALQPNSPFELYVYKSAHDYAQECISDATMRAKLVLAFDYAVPTNPAAYAQNEIDLLLGGIALKKRGILLDANALDIRLQQKIDDKISLHKNDIFSLLKKRILYPSRTLFISRQLIQDASKEKEDPIFIEYEKNLTTITFPLANY